MQSCTPIILRALPARCLRMGLRVVAVILVACVSAGRAKADLGPCTTAAPTRPDVVLFVSDIERSADWYRDNAGLKMVGSPIVERRLGSRTIVMSRNGIGVTLVSSGSIPSHRVDPQIVCFPIDGPPAPAAGSKPIFLIDPDGTSVELPAFPGS
jgi:hypothetical protein